MKPEELNLLLELLSQLAEDANAEDRKKIKEAQIVAHKRRDPHLYESSDR